jgi:capsid protein
MIHSFEPEFPGQKRGFTQFFHVLQEFENLVDFTSSTIKKAINASSRVFAVVNEQQDPSNPEEDAPKRSPIGPGVSVNSPSVDPVESATPEITNDYEWCEPPEVTDHTPGSTSWLNLAQGDKPFLFPNADNETFGAFVDSFVSYLASSKNMPVEVLKMQFNANYSASRASLVMFYNQAKIWREQMATDMLNIVFEMWLTEEIAAGRVSAPGWSDPILKKAWLKAEWYGSPMPNIDPKKESEAQMNYLKMSATTQDRVARETNGSSAESNISKNKKSFSRTPTVPWEDKEITEDPMEGENG